MKQDSVGKGSKLLVITMFYFHLYVYSNYMYKSTVILYAHGYMYSMLQLMWNYAEVHLVSDGPKLFLFYSSIIRCTTGQAVTIFA